MAVTASDIGLNKIYRDKRSGKQYIMARHRDYALVFDIDDDEGYGDMIIPITEFETYFTEVTSGFYTGMLLNLF